MNSLTNYWNENWKKWLDEEKQEESEFARKLLPVFNLKKLKSVLELGSGQGQDSLYFAKHGFEVTANDISLHALDFIKKQNPEINTIYSDIKDFNFGNTSFDIVFSHLSLHYFDYETTIKIINNVYEHINPDGMFCFKCKSIHDPMMGQGTLIQKNIYKKDDHIRHFFDIEYTKNLLRNFKNVNIKETEGYYFGKCSFIEAIAEK